jgi:Ricin-type beta-trefoil lectin domain
VFKTSLCLGPVIGIFLACAPATSFAQSIDQTFYYKLSTEFGGIEMKLDVFNGGPKNNLTRLEPDKDVAGQYWGFMSNGDGTFRLSTMFRGSEMCLDIYNGGPNNNQPHLVKCGNYTGQSWKIMVTKDGDAVRLTTVFRGPSMCLDIFNGGPNNNQPHLARCADFTGQRWILTRTDKRVEGTASHPHDGF